MLAAEMRVKCVSRYAECFNEQVTIRTDFNKISRHCNYAPCKKLSLISVLGTTLPFSLMTG